MPANWSCQGMLPSLSPGRTNSGAEYRYCNPFTARFICANETVVVFHGMRRCLPTGHPVSWDFSEVGNDFVGSNADLIQLRTVLQMELGMGISSCRSRMVTVIALWVRTFVT